jgi:tetratricopeptide (TPR) repeat protein
MAEGLFMALKTYHGQDMMKNPSTPHVPIASNTGEIPMSTRTHFFRLTVLCLAVLLAGSALAGSALAGEATVRTDSAEESPRLALGETVFPTSARNPATRAKFLEGLLALHSFEYEDARTAFKDARVLEPDFAMASWGEAMTYNHPLWLREDLEAARAALEKLGPDVASRRAKAGTERERAYLDAVELLFGEGEKLERDIAYSEAMGRVAEAWPEDLDAASFYALSLLGTCHEGRDVATYMRAAAVVEEVFAQNPRHPGAAHYLIHSYDDPVHAPLGLRPARIYAEIAPAAEHALHMPSHIFLALGMWPEVVASNIESYEAGEARRKRKGQGVERRGYHALWWLFYAHLQRGEVEEAHRLLQIVVEDAELSDNPRTRTHLAYLRAAWAVETGDWERLPPAPDFTDLDPNQVASNLFADGLAALHRGDLEEARLVLEELATHKDGGAAAEASCHAAPTGYGRFTEVDRGPVALMALQLKALVARAEGHTEHAVALLEEAAGIEADRPFGFGPPTPPKPSHELLGEVLLELGRRDEARDAFEHALERAPRRALSLAGLEASTAPNEEAATAR